MNIAINGFGRIGRTVFKILLDKKIKAKIAAINDLTDTKTLAHLFKYDSVYGVNPKQISSKPNSIIVAGKKYKVISEPDPAKLPWKELGVDLVLECTGRFRTKEEAQAHIKAGVKKVIISAPAKGEKVIKTVVLGVNEKQVKKSDKIISMASCTTNCYAPICKILNDKFKIEKSFMVTAHAVTTTQRILDMPHKDLRRSRTVLDNIIPTTSGSNKATEQVIPSLKGKLHTMAMRVPVKVGSVIYAIFDLKKKFKPGEINKVLRIAANGKFKHILKYETNPIVSADIVGDPCSAIIDSELTEDFADLVKIVPWYDNELAYSTRLAEMTEYIIKKRLL